MENFKTESRYLRLCNKFTAVMRCVKAAFDRPDYQKLLMFPLIKKLDRAFVSKHAVKPLKGSTELLKHLAKLSKHSAKLLKVKEKTKNSAESY